MTSIASPEGPGLGKLRITVPADEEYVRVVRMVVSGASAVACMGDEDTADLKVAVSEACTNAVIHAYSMSEDHSTRTIEVEMALWDGFVELDVRDQGGGVRSQDVKPGPASEAQESGFGLYLIGSLMDNVEIVGDETSGTRLKFCKCRA